MDVRLEQTRWTSIGVLGSLPGRIPNRTYVLECTRRAEIDLAEYPRRYAIHHRAGIRVMASHACGSKVRTQFGGASVKIRRSHSNARRTLHADCVRREAQQRMSTLQGWRLREPPTL